MTTRLLREGEVIQSKRLDFAGEVSTFSGSFEGIDPGEYEIQVIASQAKEANFGIASRMVTVR